METEKKIGKKKEEDSLIEWNVPIPIPISIL